MSNFKNSTESKPIGSIVTKSTADRPVRVVPGGKDFFKKPDEAGDISAERTQEDLVRVIHNQLKGCGRFREATLFMVDPEKLDSFKHQSAYIKEFPPLQNPKQMPWEVTTSSLKDVSKMIAAVLFNNHETLCFKISPEGVLAIRDQKRKFNESNVNFKPTVSWRRSSRAKNDYNAYDELNRNTF